MESISLETSIIQHSPNRYSEAASKDRCLEFKKPPAARTLAKAKSGVYGVWFDERKWQSNQPFLENHEHYFAHVDGDVYVSSVFERELPLKHMREGIIDVMNGLELYE